MCKGWKATKEDIQQLRNACEDNKPLFEQIRAMNFVEKQKQLSKEEAAREEEGKKYANEYEEYKEAASQYQPSGKEEKNIGAWQGFRKPVQQPKPDVSTTTTTTSWASRVGSKAEPEAGDTSESNSQQPEQETSSGKKVFALRRKKEHK